ncbi:MAG: glycosyltransferase family 2 protein [Thermostichales cyanobacterium SZTDM-1c_bins_54]
MEEGVWRDPEELWQAPEWLLTPAERRRLKAMIVLLTVWTGVYVLHQWPWLRWGILALSGLTLVYLTWLFQGEPEVSPSLKLTGSGIPTVSLLIPAKNEAGVLARLLVSIAELDYPHSHLDVWVVDDGSTDGTGEVLAALQERYEWLHVHRRAPGAGGGKSGALNEVLPLTVGSVVAVFDADAQLPRDLLQRALPLLQSKPGVGAVQVRKAISNVEVNAWTAGQAAEMILDAYFQQQRVAVGGFGELRGNGQLVYRSLLLRCGGWNEGTLTDDLDLSFKLHLAGAEIAFLWDPPVWEEGVTTGLRLWHQRNRWAEGGYQRFLDYWPGIVGKQLSGIKRLDLGVFFLHQYVLPMALVPDLFWAWQLDQQPLLWPLGVVAYLSMVWALWSGLRQGNDSWSWGMLKTLLLTLVYMLHWLPVMMVTTARMCVQPKRLHWVKTQHGS